MGNLGSSSIGFKLSFFMNTLRYLTAIEQNAVEDKLLFGWRTSILAKAYTVFVIKFDLFSLGSKIHDSFETCSDRGFSL